MHVPEQAESRSFGLAYFNDKRLTYLKMVAYHGCIINIYQRLWCSDDRGICYDLRFDDYPTARGNDGERNRHKRGIKGGGRQSPCEQR